MIDKHLEVQEMSTRQKLEEFKRKLAASRQGPRSTTSESVPSTPSNDKRPSAKQPKSDISTAGTEVVTPKPNQPSHETFQRRIQEENPTREHSINEILNKYRRGGRDSAEANKRTHQVNQILSKYTDSKRTPRSDSKHAYYTDRAKPSTTPHTTRPALHHSTANGVRSAPRESVSAASVTERQIEVNEFSKGVRSAHKVIAQSRIRVPNSAMEYSANLINGTDDPRAYRMGSRSGHESKPNAHAAEDNVKGHRDFKSTLEAMLKERPERSNHRSHASSNGGGAQKQV